jgi:serine phosphatase RsbU (regulator of sigma subunit)/anti-sigma regulatory factor (Ser/Thr protein kinase)
MSAGVATVVLDLPSEASALPRVRAALRELARRPIGEPLDAAELTEVELAVHEACANAVRHAHRGDASKLIRVEMRKREDALEVLVRDRGAPFDVDSARAPSPESLQEGGYGLSIMKSWMDEVSVSREDGGNVLRMVRRRRGKAAAKLELGDVVGRGAMRFVDERARLSRCKVGVFGPEGEPMRADAELSSLRPSWTGEAALVEGDSGGAEACAVVAFDWVLGFVVARAEDASVGRECARDVAEHGAAMLSELCAREYELNDLSREILGSYEELNLFYDLAGELAGAPDADAVCRVVLARAQRAIGAAGGRVLLADGERSALRVASSADGSDEGSVVAVDAGRAGAAFTSRVAEIVDDVSIFDGAGLAGFERAASSLVTVPLCVTGKGDRPALGVLQLRDKADEAPFTAGDLKLARAIASQAAALIQNSRLIGIERELKIARTIQQRLLPDAPPAVAGLDVAGVCVPARNVGGDYFDHIASGPTSLAFLVADVSGHDLAAALMQTAARAAFRAAALADVPPGEVVRRASLALRDDLSRAEMFLTAWFGRVDAATGELTYCDAGHDSVVLRRFATGKTSRLVTDGIPIGVGEHETFEEGRVVLEPGDVVVACTDGLIDARGADEAAGAYGEERLKAAVAGAASLPAAEIVRAVLEDVARFTGGGEAGDDRTLVVVRRTGPGAEGASLKPGASGIR